MGAIRRKIGTALEGWSKRKLEKLEHRVLDTYKPEAARNWPLKIRKKRSDKLERVQKRHTTGFIGRAIKRIKGQE
ncbi:MAG TPA: hypothetical protein VJG83_03845 [archaeon]|nr:hypothetical protein [archaeon]